jgi:cellulose synthase/poly-beta-1,6-N-acetylglucosamine synthase-like glycosyltransferase
MKDKFSLQIIILYYFEFEYFQLALTSVRSQDYSDFSILIIDDGTFDERLVNYIHSLKDPRITFKQNSSNLGLPKNFELARKTAQASYLVFLGQDDVLEPDYISSVLPWFMKSNSIAIVQPRVKVINESGNQIFPITDMAKNILNQCARFIGKKITFEGQTGSILVKRQAASILLLGDFLYFPTLMWNSSFMNEFDTSKNVTLDYLMIMDVLGKDGELLLLHSQSARYRRHQRSASMSPEKMLDRLLEERTFHLEMRNHPILRNSKMLRIVNRLRVMQRLHGLQVFAKSLLSLDLTSSKRALSSIR